MISLFSSVGAVMPFSESALQELQNILSRYPSKRSAALPALQLAQREFGYVTDEAVREIAKLLDLTPTDVASVAGFYSMIYRKPVGKYVLDVCDDLPCALVGAERIVDYISKKLGLKPGETTPDGLFTLHTVMCVAACDRAPCMQVNAEYYENLTEARVDEILEKLRKQGKEGKQGK